MVRTISEEHWSNPLKLLEEFLRKKTESANHITYKTFIDCIVDTIYLVNLYKNNRILYPSKN